MQALQLLMTLLAAGERAMELARTLAEAKKNAEAQGRDLTADELRAFKARAHTVIGQLDQTIAGMKDDG